MEVPLPGLMAGLDAGQDASMTSMTALNAMGAVHSHAAEIGQA